MNLLQWILAFSICFPLTFQIDFDADVGIEYRVLQSADSAAAIIDSIELDPELILYVDPPDQYNSPTLLGVFARGTDPATRVYYDEFGNPPSLDSSFVTYSSPYIELGTPFKGSRNRTISLVAVLDDEQQGVFRSEQITMNYFVEGAARPFSFGFLVPGVESGGFFVRFGIEIAATARAQVAGGQEFADFFSELGKGTYLDQIDALDLVALDPDLSGFEGGFPVNTSTNKHYGILIPYHNGNDFFGKVVRVNLRDMGNTTICSNRYRTERYDANGELVIGGSTDAITGDVVSAEEACVMVLDLTSLHPNAKGFRKGFLGFPYGYLSAGEFDVLVRINLENFGLATTQLLDLSLIDPTYSGYSGGFADGSWACFSPYKTFAGPVGGIRSKLRIDANSLRPYYYSTMLCANDTAWNAQAVEISSSSSLISEEDKVNLHTTVLSAIRTIDLSVFEQNLRGFSEAIRAGRYAYLAPLSHAEHVYSSQLVRISLGDVDIGTAIDDSTSIRDLIDVLDLAKFNPALKGFSGMFVTGKQLILVPFRNDFEPRNGQRGHGSLVRLDMNFFSLAGLEFIDLPTTTRTQVPSFADVDLRGFYGGFASGQYGLLVPFYNALFNGRIARFVVIESSLAANLQELDVAVDRKRPQVYKGYRGGFVSQWQGVEF